MYFIEKLKKWLFGNDWKRNEILYLDFTHSYRMDRTEKPGLTLVDAINAWALNFPVDEAFRFVGVNEPYASLTPSYIRDQARKFAARLRQYGFTDGDVIGNSIPNSPERLVTDLGIILAGCVTLDCEVTEGFSEYFWTIARQAECKGVILTTRQDSQAFQLFKPHMSDPAQTSGDAPVSVDHAPSLYKLVFCHRDSEGDSSLLDSLEEDEEEGFFSTPSPDDLAALFLTTGSRGSCYLIPRSHSELMLLGKMYDKVKAGSFFLDAPLGWIIGFPFEFLYPVYTRVLLDYYELNTKVSYRDLWSVISREKCHVAFLIPQAVSELIHIMRDNKPRFKVQMVITGGQPILQTVTGAVGLFTDIIKVIYISTEAGLISSGNVVQSNKGEMKQYYSGTPIKSVQIQILNEEGEAAPPFVVGDIYVKSPTVTKGYYHQSTPSNMFTADSFFRTSDRGYLDDHGSLYCYGRGGDTLRVGFEVFYASHIREILYQCPDVQRNYVVTVKDKSGKEKFYACIVPITGARLSKEYIEKHCYQYFTKPHSMLDVSQYKNGAIQDFLEFLFFEKLPESQNGKVQPIVLKEMVRIRMGFDNN
ncbi:hypothetical protein Btru_064856 [Bulinus truncatus]|nr:hypothetical protein Btru_064856 [Bulinus truncatus]